jgi:hypothetical protein
MVAGTPPSPLPQARMFFVGDAPVAIFHSMRRPNTSAGIPQMSAEDVRLERARTGNEAWRLWGPYLSERQLGTVREDYSENGNAWECLP